MSFTLHVAETNVGWCASWHCRRCCCPRWWCERDPFSVWVWDKVQSNSALCIDRLCSWSSARRGRDGMSISAEYSSRKRQRNDIPKTMLRWHARNRLKQEYRELFVGRSGRHRYHLEYEAFLSMVDGWVWVLCVQSHQFAQDLFS